MRPAPSTSRGFTLIELLFTIGVVAVLIGLISVGVWGARRAARGAGDQFMASGLGAATEQFKNDFGFLPPLVVDGDPLLVSGDDPDAPVIQDPRRNELQRIALRDARFLTGRDGSGNIDPAIRDPGSGGAGAGASYSDKRYSKLSLTYYLMGACNAPRDPDEPERPIDGVAGAGFRTPMRDGRFEPGGRTFEPFYVPRQGDRIIRGFADRLEYREHGQSAGSIDAPDESVALVDSEGRAFRYYRWTNGRPGAADDAMGEFMNVPKLFQDPHTWGDPDASASGEFAGASYAIVGAGPDGLFGTEPAEELERVIGNRSDINNEDSVLELRRIAQEDNVVEVGR